MRQVRVFVSSPFDARFERNRLERVVERLNGEFQGVAQLAAVRWESEFYRAHDTFQAQIPEAARCDIVIAIFRARLGTELPPDFPLMGDGKPYPSGTAYEVLSAIEASKGLGLPDVYVFRYPDPPHVQLDDPGRGEIESQWNHLKRFFEDWFQSSNGGFKAAFQTFSSTDDFESQAEVLLRKWLEEKTLRGRAITWPTSLKGSPFRGLASFGTKHATVFFGRGRDVAKAVDRLKDGFDRGCPFLLVIGGSGAGKSSLVRAGLAPRLTAAGVVPAVDIWRIASMRPGDFSGDPLAALAHALFTGPTDLPDDEQGRPPALPELRTSDFNTQDALAALLGHADDVALKPIMGALAAIEQTARATEGFGREVKAALLLIVDQLDELFDVQVTDEARTAFAKLLTLLVRSGRVWVVTTLRADLFDRFLSQPALKLLKDEGASYDLAPPDAAELAEIVRGPASAADLVYETDLATGERLDERLLKDAGRPDLLPLLQFALSELFEARETVNGEVRLTFAAYRKLGGLDGAIDKGAEAAIEALGETEHAALPRLLRDLVMPAQDGLAGAGRSGYDIRSVPMAQLGYDAASSSLVRALVDARILLSSGMGGLATVHLAHTRVVDSWRRANNIVAQNADFYRIRGQVEEQRRRWEAGNRSRDLLIGRGRPLAEAESIVRQFPEELTPPVRDFIAQSARRARLFQTMSAAAAVVFALVAAGAVFGARQAIVSRDAAILAQRQAELAREQAEDARHRSEQGIAAADTMLFGAGRIEELRGCLAATQRVAATIRRPASKDFFVGEWHVVNSGSSTFVDWLGDGSCKIKVITFGQHVQNFDDAVCTWTYKVIDANDFEIDSADNTGLDLTHHMRFKIIDYSRIHNIEADYDAVRVVCPAAERDLYQQELQSRQQSAATEPADPDRQLAVAAIYTAMGNAQSDQGMPAEAALAYDESLTIVRKLADAHPDNIDWQHELAVTYFRVGQAQVTLKHLPSALEACRTGIAVMDKVAAAQPGNADWQHELALDYSTIGNLTVTANKAYALKAYQQAIEILRKLALARPGDTKVQIDLAITFYYVSRVVDIAAARKALESGLGIVDTLENEHKLTDQQSMLPYFFRQQLAKLSETGH
jgi:eukaryotic-like serine/threonine-protein kinase